LTRSVFCCHCGRLSKKTPWQGSIPRAPRFACAASCSRPAVYVVFLYLSWAAFRREMAAGCDRNLGNVAFTQALLQAYPARVPC
jgi:hypothetical protein